MFLQSPQEQMREHHLTSLPSSPSKSALTLPEDLNAFWSELDQKGWGAFHDVMAFSKEGFTFLSFVLFYCPGVMHQALAIVKDHPEKEHLINQPDPFGHHQGWTPLHWASRLYQGQVWVRDLLELGANPLETCTDGTDDPNDSPAALGLLMLSFNPRLQQFFAPDIEASEDAGQALIEYGSNLAHINEENMTPLHNGVTVTPHLVHFLLEDPVGASTINAVDIFGNTALTRALIHNPQLCDALLDAGADPWMALTRKDQAFTSAVDVAEKLLSGDLGSPHSFTKRGTWKSVLERMYTMKSN